MIVREIKNREELNSLFNHSADYQNLMLENFFARKSEDIFLEYEKLERNEDKLEFIVSNRRNHIKFVRVYHIARHKKPYDILMKTRDLLYFENDLSIFLQENNLLEKCREYFKNSSKDDYWNAFCCFDYSLFNSYRGVLDQPDTLCGFQTRERLAFRDFTEGRIPLIYQVDVPVDTITFYNLDMPDVDLTEVDSDTLYILNLLEKNKMCGVENYFLSSTDVVYDLSEYEKIKFQKKY